MKPHFQQPHLSQPSPAKSGEGIHATSSSDCAPFLSSQLAAFWKSVEMLLAPTQNLVMRKRGKWQRHAFSPWRIIPTQWLDPIRGPTARTGPPLGSPISSGERNRGWSKGSLIDKIFSVPGFWVRVWHARLLLRPRDGWDGSMPEILEGAHGVFEWSGGKINFALH
jgi:hypothetical protein